MQMANPADKMKKVKLDERENNDRLSDLPDCVIIHILSFLNTRDTVRTSVLSPRWKDIWKRVPALNLKSKHFRSLKIFTKFVLKVLSLRDSSIALDTLIFKRDGYVEPRILKKIVNYAHSHNVQRLKFSMICDVEHIPHRVFSCETLTYLKLIVFPKNYHMCGTIPSKLSFPKSINLPALITLYLFNFTFSASDNNGGVAEPFSSLTRLKTLFLHNCALSDAVTLRISSDTLVNFTMKDADSPEFFNVEICTPSLRTFTFAETLNQKFYGSGLTCVTHANIDANVLNKKTDPLLLLSLLSELVNIRSLTVTARTLEVLSLHPNLSKTKLPSLGNLKSLKVKRNARPYLKSKKHFEERNKYIESQKFLNRLRESFEEGFKKLKPIPDGMIEYLLQNSPSAEVDIVDLW